MEEQFVLEMENITKEYYGNTVLKNVSLKVKLGEIHALMGENGAGKSTLMNILFGMPVIHASGGFGGSLKIAGREVTMDTTQKALEEGIGMVHQEFMLIPGFTIVENIKLGREITNPTIASRVLGKSLEKLDMKAMAKDARLALDNIGMGIDEYTKIAGMPIGYMQFVEIAREIDKEGIKLLVFDEPTAVLTESEADRLLAVMRIIAAKGIAIIFISHRLDEIMAAADAVTILRDGELVAVRDVKDTSTTEIAALMIGRKVEKLVSADELKRTIDPEDIALSVRNLVVDMPGEQVDGVDFDVAKGEIFGIGGLAGQGKVGIPNGIRGLYPTSGDVTVFGEKIDFATLGDALNKGAAFVSEDRRGVGLLLEESIEHNIVFSAIQLKNDFMVNLGICRLIDKKKARRHAEEMVKTLDIRCTGTRQKAGSLSGGNQQKVCLANALTLNPKILFVSEPTRGIDIGAKKLVLEYLVKLSREEGLTVIIVSSELTELRSICDRIAVVTDGRIAQILPPDATDAAFGLAMARGKEERDGTNG